MIFNLAIEIAPRQRYPLGMLKWMVVGMVLICGLAYAEQPEVRLQPDLLIVCPKCGFVFYQCEVSELFGGDPVKSDICKPFSPEIQELRPGIDILCPIDGIRPYKTTKWKNGNITTQVFTNKGWMPRRYRPVVGHLYE